MKQFFYALLLLSTVCFAREGLQDITVEDLDNYGFKAPSAPTITKITTEVSAGELIDKITILEIKLERICDPKKLINVQNELRALLETATTMLPPSATLNELTDRLREINAKLWDLEDNIRLKIAKSEYDNEFVNYAVAIPVTNDKRAEVKRKINDFLGSRLVEEKSLPRYAAS